MSRYEVQSIRLSYVFACLVCCAGLFATGCGLVVIDTDESNVSSDENTTTKDWSDGDVPEPKNPPTGDCDGSGMQTPLNTVDHCGACVIKCQNTDPCLWNGTPGFANYACGYKL